MCPQFIPSAHPPAVSNGIVAGILQAAEFADLDEADTGKSIRGWTRHALKIAEDIATQFIALAGQEAIDAALAAYAERSGQEGYSPQEALGHDIWLTLGGHGVGFWDRDDAAIKAMDVFAQQMRQDRYVYRTRGGWLDFD